jgi:hypothetical protein
MQGVTVYVRTFGDALAGLLPVIQPLFDAVGQFVANYAQGLVPILQAAAPFIELFTDSLVTLMGELSKGIAFIQGFVAELITTLAALFGLEHSRFRAGASSSGFAARQTHVSGVKEFADAVFAANAKNIYARQGGGKAPGQDVAEIREAIINGRVKFDKLADDVNAIANWFRRRAEEIGANVGGAGAMGVGAGAAVGRAAQNWWITKPW